MNERPRGPNALTQRVLQAGAIFVSGLFVTALVLHVLGSNIAERAATLGVVSLIATPAAALAASAIEHWTRERATALLALAVLAVLGVATAVAVIIER